MTSNDYSHILICTFSILTLLHATINNKEKQALRPYPGKLPSLRWSPGRLQGAENEQQNHSRYRIKPRHWKRHCRCIGRNRLSMSPSTMPAITKPPKKPSNSAVEASAPKQGRFAAFRGDIANPEDRNRLLNEVLAGIRRYPRTDQQRRSGSLLNAGISWRWKKTPSIALSIPTSKGSFFLSQKR